MPPTPPIQLRRLGPSELLMADDRDRRITHRVPPRVGGDEPAWVGPLGGRLHAQRPKPLAHVHPLRAVLPPLDVLLGGQPDRTSDTWYPVKPHMMSERKTAKSIRKTLSVCPTSRSRRAAAVAIPEE